MTAAALGGGRRAVGFGAGVETYVLIANTSNVAGTATVTVLPHSSFTPPVVTVPLPAQQPRQCAMSQLPGLPSLAARTSAC